MNEESEPTPFNFSTDDGAIQVTYRRVPFEIKTLYSPSGKWTAYVTSAAITTSIFPNPPTYATRSAALAAMLQIAVESLDTLLDTCESLLQQLGEGNPVVFQDDDPVSDMVRTLVEGLLASDDLDHASAFMQRFRRAFEQSQQ